MYDIKILLVEDDLHLQTILSKYLKNEGYHLEVASDGEEAFALLDYDEYHLAILDVMLPDTDGWTILKSIKKTSKTPVIMLTARSQEDDKLHGFDLGADDYITKPFSAKELMARVKIQLRHAMPTQTENITIGQLEVDTDLRVVKVAGDLVALTSLEYDLLMYFIDNCKIALSRQQLLDHVWGMDYYGDRRTVDTHVKRLRKKLLVCGSYITTVRGLGYRWDGEHNV